ncbi:hypothetical protein SDRG_01708 [Saprolegnia diclina VS20]|uniref:Dynein heavy chain linker domain-containing protein n=1 Tax=Saprolegnia diclina (strain VS20) TaxID=1156394 RepID=T0R0Z8_SAPDV|nr:hypothetical protein SDRG_01708 [Saprolegnia diclina VS20]EQC40626.1 hypothetical protein SDRG_01708 [Saprolegnia diclina VS20]|eukprot:XP_008605470.1 hypothetical protein SDRG_01708 [Saprolegnia diclina VS20]
MPRRRAPSHPDVLALAARASHGADAPLKDQLLRRVTSSVAVPSQQSSMCRDDRPRNQAPENLDIIDSADKLLAYMLHVIDSRGRVEPRAICIQEPLTLQDAVFAPRRKPIEVLYLTYNPHPPCHFRNVYWLVRAPKDMDLRDEYFTLTSYGLTRVLGLESELFDLEAWLREKAIFDKIVQMQCIHQMRKMTVFHTWKHNTIGLRIAHAKKQLGEALLACHPIAGPFLLTVQRLVLDMIHALSSDIVPRGNPQPVQALSNNRVPTEATRAQIASTVTHIQALLLDALHRLRAGPNPDVTTVRYGRLLANADVLPVLIRTVDFMLLGAYFGGIMTALERLNVSVTGSIVSALEARGSSTVGVAGTSGARDRYLHMDQLLEMPTEHSGSIAYKRLFHLHGDALPDPLFFVEMTVGDAVIISPTKDVTVRHVYEAIAFAIECVDAFPRVVNAERVRAFVHDHCRPFYRHCFGQHLLPASATLRNHSVVERIMKGLRAATDIYYVEMEELAQASRLVHVEFARLQDQLAVTTRDETELESNVLNAMPESNTSDDLVAFVEALEMTLQFQADLRMVDSLLQIGPFLVNRSAFIGSSLDACSAMLRRLFDLAPVRCNCYYQASHASYVGHTKLLSSIPDSLAESVAWLETFLMLRTDLPDDAEDGDHPAARLQSLLQASDVSCDSIDYETKCALVGKTKTDQVKWRVATKSLHECISRIETNSSFYMEILTRTIAVRQETLFSEMQMLWTMLEIEWQAIQAEDAATEAVPTGFYGRAKAVPDLVSQTKLLLHTDAELRRIVGRLEYFDPAHAGLCQRPSKTAKQRAWLQGLLILHDNIQRLIDLKTRVASEPLNVLDMTALAHTLEAISWQIHPLGTVLGPSQPLLLRFQRHFAAMELAIATAERMLSFKPDTWRSIASTPDACTLSQLDEWLATPTKKAELDALCSECVLQLSVHATWRTVSDQLRRLTLTLTPMHRLVFVTNVHDLIAACEDAQLSLLTIQHRGNPALSELQATQASLARALDVLYNLDRLQEAWHATGVLVDLPEARKVCDATFDAALQTLDVVSSQWRDRVMGLSRTLELQNQGPTLEKLRAAFDGFDFNASIAACDALGAAMAATYASMRSEVPRLCFLSDADLWALVTRKASPDAVRDIVVRCFDGVADVDVVVEATTIVSDDAMTSHSFTQWMLAGHAVTLLEAVVYLDGIRLQLPQPFRVVGSLVFWLSRLDTDLRRVMLTLLGEAQGAITYDASNSALCEWLSTYSLPIVLAYLHKSFCISVHCVLHAKSAAVAAKHVQLTTTTSTHATHFLRLVASLRHPRPMSTVLKLEAVVLLLKYELETLEAMTQVASTREWADVTNAFHSALRFESPRENDSSHLVAAMGHVTMACDVHVDVHAPLLFLTPPTTRCAYALLHVLQLNLCVVPFAQHGSGKRTLLRSLGSFLMRYFVLFQASEATSHRVLNHWLAGVDALRAWVCVTDVFALPLSVLRVFFADVLQLQHVRFGPTIRWRHEDAGGALFLPVHGLTPPTHVLGPWLGQPLRPLAVVAHDRRLLLQSLLYMKGFSEPLHAELDGFLTTLVLLEPNAERFFTVSLYLRVTTLASAIVKSVSYILRSAEHAASHLTHNASPLNIMRYKDTNVLRFALLLVLSPLVDATPLTSALDRFFPSNLELGQEYRMLEAAVRVVLEKASLVATPQLVAKTVALYNQIQMRAPVLLVGPAGAGKSTLLKACLQAQQLMRWTMCPQSDPSTHLTKRINLVVLGMIELEHMQLHSHLRRQGSTNAILHTFCQRPPIVATETMSCVLFDGPLPQHPSALETLVSLLSGDRHLYFPPPLPPQHRAASFDCTILETAALSDASPAIVTSCSILSLNDTVVPWTALVDAWFAQQGSVLPPGFVALAKPMVLHCLGACTLPQLQLTTPSVPVSQVVANVLKLLTAMFGSLVHDGASIWPLSPTVTGQLVFLLVLWGTGAHLTSERRRDLQAFALGVANMPPIVVDANGLVHQFPQLPHETQPTFFEIVFSARDHAFGLTSACQETTLALQRVASAVIVPTAQIRFAYCTFQVLQKWSATRSMLFLGGRGVGKSTLLSVLPRLVRGHKTRVWSRASTEHRYVSLLHRILHQTSDDKYVFLDDVNCYGPSLELLRCVLSHKRLFDAVRSQWTRLQIAFCGTMSLAHNAPLSLAEQRCLRPYFLLRLTDPDATELAAIHSAIVQERLGRPLAPSEHWIVRTTVTAVLSLSSKPANRILLSPTITADVIRSTLRGEVPNEALTHARWLREMHSAMYSAFASETERTDWLQQFKADIPSHTTPPEFDSDASFLPLVRTLPLPTAVLDAAERSAETAFDALRAFLLSSLKPTAVDMEWTARLSPPLIWHYVQLCAILEAHRHVMCIGSGELVAAYMPLLPHVVRTCSQPPPIVLADLTSDEDVVAHLASLLLATGIHDERRILCATEADWTQWPRVALFVHDILDGNHSQLARSVVLQHVVATPLSSASHVDILDAFMRRVQRHLTLVLWGSSASIAPLLTHASANVRVIALQSPHRHEADLLLAAKGTMTHLRDAHPDLGLSLSDCDHLATISVQVHASVASPTKSLGHLLETFVHIMAYKASKMADVRIESVTQLLTWLDTLKAQCHDATERLEQLETAFVAAQDRREAAEASLGPMQAQLTASKGLNERLAEKLRALQEAFGSDKHAMEAIERQIRAERKVLNSLLLPAFTLADRQKLADEWRHVTACRHLLAAMCRVHGVDDHNVEAACRLVENPNTRMELLAMRLSAESATQPFGFTAADIPTLHTLHPALAVLGRALLYQRDAASADAQVTRLSGANARRTSDIEQVRTELKELHASMALLEASILRTGNGVASDTQALGELATAMEATEANVDNLAPLLSYLDRLQALIRSTYFAQRYATHLTSEGAALFTSAMVAYLGPLDTAERARLIQSWSLVFTSNNYVLPLELGIVQDSAVALYSTLEASICVPNMDKRLQHGLAIADWSQTCPLLVDPNGAAESYMVAFFQRMTSATPAVTYSVYSTSDANLLQCLDVARKASKVVLLTHYSTNVSDARFRQLLPYLRVTRRPLLDAARGLPLLSHSGSTKLLQPTTAPSRRARSSSMPDLRFVGTFQVYVILSPLDNVADLSQLQKAHFNLIDFQVPRKELERRKRRTLHALLAPNDVKANDDQATLALKAQAQLRKMQDDAVAKLLEGVSTLDSDALLKLLTHLEQKDRVLRSRVSRLQTSIAPPDALTNAARTLASLQEALQTLAPLDSLAMPRGKYMQVLLEKMLHRVLRVSSSDMESVLLDVLARVLAHVARRVASEHLDALYTLIALLQSVETPTEVLRWVRFLASPAAHVAQAEKAVVTQYCRRASDMRGPNASMGHVHRLRRLRSTIAVPDHATHDDSRSLHGLSLPQLLPAALPPPHALISSGFLSQEMYEGLAFLEAHMHELRGLSDAIQADPTPWRQSLVSALESEHSVLLWPAPWTSRLAPPLVSLLCTKCLCPELVSIALTRLKATALKALLPGGISLHETICTPYVVLVAPNDAPLPQHVHELDLNLASRIIFQPRTAAATLAAALASDTSLVVQISCADDADALLEILKAHTLLHPVFILVDALLLPELPRALLYQSQIVRLPITPMVAADAPSPRLIVHESHLHHSAAETLARKMPRLHACAVEKSEAMAVGWTQFVARDYHLEEAVATLQQLCEASANDADAVASAIQGGVYGADMIPRDMAAATFLLTEPVPRPRDVSLYLRNATHARHSLRSQKHLRRLTAPLEHAPSSSLEMVKAMLTTYLRRFQEIAMPTRSTKPVVGHRGVGMAALDAVFHRLKADSSAFYHLLLTFLSGVNESALPYLDLHVLPPSWLGLPETTHLLPVRLHALVAQLDRRCDYLHFLGHPSAQSVDVGLTLHLRDVLGHIRLVYSDALGCCVTALRLALRASCSKDESVGGVAQDAAQHPCGLVVDSLWLFYGSAFAKVPTARLVWEQNPSESQSRELSLAFYGLWLLRHVGEAPWGDPRVFTCIQESVGVAPSDCNALFGDDVGVDMVVEYGTLLAPALPELPDVVTLLQPSRQ